jgi:HAMP domain-containing protein
MKLMGKFNSIFILIFGVMIAAAGVVLHSFFESNARKQVLEQARLMMEASLSVRTYTSKEIDPLLQSLAGDREFYAQSVPAFAAMESSQYMHAKNPAYSYKEATLNPTNLRDRATDWEADIIRVFRDDRTRQEFDTVRESATGPSLVFSRPIVVQADCLRCHSTPAAAPAAMIRQYGKAHGFGWKLNDVVGAQVISVPMAVPVAMAGEAFRSAMAALMVMVLLTLVALNVALSIFVVKPVSRFARMADEVSKGNLSVPEVTVRGQDEISTLAAAFYRMRLSLTKALDMLGKNE